MKDLVANKQLTEEDDEVSMNPRCSDLLQNQLPPKENDPGSFILPCSIKRMPVILGRPLLATAHVKVDIFRKTISLEVRNEKVILKMRSNFSDNIHESVRMIKTKVNTKEDELMKIDSDLFTYNTEAYEINHLLSIDPDVFTYDIEVQESYEEIVYRCSLIAQETNRELSPFEEKFDGGSLCHNEIKCYKESENNGKQIDVEWENLSLNDWLRIRFGEVSETARDKIPKDHWRKRFGDEYDDNKDFKDPDGCRERSEEDDDDIEGIIDYLEPTLYDRFIDSDDEEYKERKCRLMGIPYIKPPPILIEKVKVTRYSVGQGEVYTKIKVSEVEELSRTRGNIATIRAGIME
ncbi:hypothetical protein Tco_1060974 [Tanacetum coccineum]